MMDKLTEHKEICEYLNELYRKKNADYGDSFGKSFDDWGMTMACIRLGDKLNRLTSLAKSKDPGYLVDDESVEDTLMDLANYAIMTIIEIRNQREG